MYVSATSGSSLVMMVMRYAPGLSVVPLQLSVAWGGLHVAIHD